MSTTGNANLTGAWRIYDEAGEHIATVYTQAEADRELAKARDRGYFYSAAPVQIKSPRW